MKLSFTTSFDLLAARVIGFLVVICCANLAVVAQEQADQPKVEIREPNPKIDNSRTVPAGAQEDANEPEEDGDDALGLNKFGGGKQTIASGLGFKNEEPYVLTAKFELAKGTRSGRLSVTMALNEGWHTYTTNPTKGAIPTTIGIDETSANVASLAGDFVADQKHEDVERPDGRGGTTRTQEYHGTVTWTAPITFVDGVDISKAEIAVVHDAQVCSDPDPVKEIPGKCIPVTQTVIATFAGEYEPEEGPANASDEIYQGEQITFRGIVEAETFTPGSQVRLIIEAKPAPGYHIYWMDTPAEKPPPGTALPTVLGIADSKGLRPGTITANQPVVRDGKNTPHHKGAVTWTLPLTIPQDAAPGEVILKGALGYQICQAKNCLPPSGANFEVGIPVGNESGLLVTFAWTEGGYNDAAKMFKANPLQIDNGKKTPPRNSTGTASAPNGVRDLSPANVQSDSLLVNFLLGILGGFILNFMPCVLPVIGIKILSFAEQAGKNVWKITAYNIAYTLGLLSVFWTLATFAALPGVFFEDSLIWGELFGFVAYRIGMIALVFTMALSFLGVWEIPLPGFVGSGKAVDLQSQEGLVGAFFKGIFTTVLATPCSGPFLGPVFGYASAQPAYAVYVIFTGVGLGMALPYLLIGWFPFLMKWMPKPGPWMDTFKQLMGFVLLGVVVWLFSTLSESYFVPTLAFVVALWFGCWLIGQVPVWETTRKQLTVWAGAILVAGVVGYFAYAGKTESRGGPITKSDIPIMGPATDNRPVEPTGHLYDWVPYNEEALAQARAEGKTVMIDFTADWCNNCQLNFYGVLNTEATKNIVELNGIVPMLADFTDRPSHIKKKLREFRQASIPFLVIYPANGGEPIRMQDVITQKSLEEKLLSAGPSKSVGNAKAGNDMSKAGWIPYTEEALQSAQAEGKTVLIDFTAKWCLSCNTVVWPALQSESVQDKLHKNDVVTMLADFTDRPRHIRRKLVEFGNPALPFILVYPGDGSEPITLRDGVFARHIERALDLAGPSKVTNNRNTNGETLVINSPARR